MRPDFMLMPSTGKLCDILELRLPRIRLMIARDNRGHRMSTGVASAVAQLRYYDRFFSDPRNRDDFAERYGMVCYRPRLLLLAGRTDASDEALMRVRDIEMDCPGLRVITYDLLLEAAKNSLITHLA